MPTINLDGIELPISSSMTIRAHYIAKSYNNISGKLCLHVNIL